MSQTSDGSTATTRTRSTSRRGSFIIITIIFPIAFLILIECVLRLSHFGPDLSLFTTVTIAGKTFRVMNPGVKNRYFSQVWFNPATSADLFEVPKPAGTYRIFCLGGSTTVGYPYWYNGAFPSFLRSRLSEIFPHRSIEVINVGMTATNSFTVLDMASDIMNEQPDLLIVYDGHNEFYGALGVASRDAWGGARWMTRLALRLIHLKTAYLLRDIIVLVRDLFGHSNESPQGTMMERLAHGRFVPYGSDLYRKALEDFSGNMEELKRLCTEKNTPLIFSTQVSNLRDLAPFVSRAMPGGTPEKEAAFNALMNDALAAAMNGLGDSAKSLYRQAEVLDPFRAETRYNFALCLDGLDEKAEAKAEFIRARDYDQLRFRASSDFNNAIRSTADGRTTFLVDIEKTFMGASPDSLVGTGLLFEHVHPRSAGAFLMAKCYVTALRDYSLFATPAEWRAADTIADASLWKDRPVSDLDEAIARRRTDILLSGWPFQPIDRPPRPVPAADYLAAIADSVVFGELGWDEGHRRVAEHDESTGDTVNAMTEYRILLRQLLLFTGEPGLAGLKGDESLSAVIEKYIKLRSDHSSH